MRLHEFMAKERDALFAESMRKLREIAPGRDVEELASSIRRFIDEVIGALRRADGLTADTPRPDLTAATAAVGRATRRRGLRIGEAAQTYTTLSAALGVVGGRAGCTFDAREYGEFNQVIDRTVAAAIEDFASDEREAMDRAFGERLGFLAHELRSALSSARMAAQLIERGQVAVGGRTAEILRRNLTRMDRLIEQTLVESRLTQGAPVVIHPVALAALLDDIEASAIVERGMRLALECAPALGAMADEHLLTSAIGNLVQNAIKFSHEGATITVRARADGDDAVIEVEDECGGLPSGDPERLFAPFVRAGGNRRGVGLGLAITRDVVATLHGTIAVRDLPGRGCVFAVQLPRANA